MLKGKEGAVPFAEVYESGQRSRAQVGDRFIYDRRNGTLLIHRESGDVQLVDNGRLSTRCFVGRHWTKELTQASAELYARLGGLKGAVVHVEGSFPTLLTFEVVA